MSRVEELPDNYEEPDVPISLKSSSDIFSPPPKPSPSATAAAFSNGSAPAPAPAPIPASSTASAPLPPHLSDTHAQTVDEVVADLKKTPFFMTSLDDAGDEPNPELDAIKALLYEGSRAEIALNFKEQGNEQVSAKSWRDAKALYTKGLAALEAPRKEQEPAGDEEDKKEGELKAVLLANRARAHLELQNYRSCSLDCMACLELNPRNIKACFRLASALFALIRVGDAMAACNAGLEIDGGNKALLSLRERIEKKQTEVDKKEEARREREEREQKVAQTLATSLAARKILVRRTKDKPDLPDDAEMKLVPDPLSMTSTLVFPVVVLYPLHGQSDVIKSFGEEQTLTKHLQYLLPLPWDERQEYKVKELEAYLETREGGLLKWGKNVELLRVLSGGKVEIVDGIVRVNLIPKKRSGEWIAELKRRKGKPY